MQDTIADMFIRIKNAQAGGKEFVTMPSSKMKIAISKVLKDEGYILEHKTSSDSKPQLTITLKYYNEKPVIEMLKRISRPGLRRYSGHDDLPKVLSGLGINIVSTSKGVMSDRAARALKLGGEIIAQVA